MPVDTDAFYCLKSVIGLTLSTVTHGDSGSLILKFTGGQILTLYHEQDCCESVWLEDGLAELKALQGQVIQHFREEVHVDPYSNNASGTWTFYLIRTHAGEATLRWIGESNGNYSESVDVELRTP